MSPCFADDLILFCEGDFYSIFTLLRGFETFSKASGLQENAAKSELCASNMDPGTRRRVLDVSGFKEGQTPF